ncbi:MAG: LuxR C-terminal-related transcriptional regulator [Lachnospiraceae bacterium]|nr:LuxR C-terminal-related transcriptional regulator [Lachnospiraceae bacterium]
MNRLMNNAVKEAFDNLPSGVCFFDKNGTVTLCNHQMYHVFFALTGMDLQSLPELQDFLNSHGNESRRDHEFFLLEDNTAWTFAQEQITTQEGETYTQVTASDVAELYLRQKELEEEMRKLKKHAERIRRLSSDILALIREEEILNMKMRVHDDIGIRVLIDGEFPEQTAVKELFLSVIRECMTNAVRHAGAKELYIRFVCSGQQAAVTVTNDGASPEGEIVEGGGLTSLLSLVKKSGATRAIKSRFPQIRVIIVTSMLDVDYLNRAREVGADSLYFKDVSQMELMKVAELTMRGESVYPDKAPEVRIGNIMSSDFTEKEIRVLRLMIEGMTYKEMAEQLHVTTDCVKKHISSMLSKTGYPSKTKLIAMVVSKRLIVNGF